MQEERNTCEAAQAAPVSLLDKWRKKSDLETKTIIFDGQPIVIREMTYAEKSKLAKFTSNLKCAFYIWDTCIVTEELELFEQEFNELMKLNSKEMSKIVDQCLSFSGMSEAELLLEGND